MPIRQLSFNCILSIDSPFIFSTSNRIEIAVALASYELLIASRTMSSGFEKSFAISINSE